MLLPSLVVASFLCCANAERMDYSADVRALVDKYREMSAPSDILKSFERLGDDSRELFKLAHPIGSLLIITTIEKDSDEAKSMSDLREFLQIVKANTTSQEDYGVIQGGNIYNEIVTLTSGNRRNSDIEASVQKLNRIFYEIFTDPDYLLDPYFNSGIYNIHDISTITRRMDYFTLVNCRTPTDEEMVKFRRIQESFIRLASRISAVLQGRIFRGWDFSMNDFLSIALRAPTGYVNWMVTEIDKIDASSDDYELYGNLSKIMNKKYENEETKEMARWSNVCKRKERDAQGEYVYGELDNITSTTFEFNTTVLLNELRRFYSDLLRLVLAKSIIMAMEQKNADEIAITLRQTGNHISEWARQIQDFCWPKIGIDSAKEAIGFSPIPVESYNATSQAVKSALEAQGSKSFAYQVLVVPTSRVDIDWSVASVKSDLTHMSSYTNIIDHNGLDIHIFRVNQTKAVKRTSNEMKSFYKHFEEPLRKFRYNGSAHAVNLLVKLKGGSPVFENLQPVFLMRSVQLTNSTEFSPLPFGLANDGKELANLDIKDGNYPACSWKLFFFD